MSPVPLKPLFGRTVRRIHCVGVGGTGMAPLAIYLAGSGYSVTGEDQDISPDVRRQLGKMGISLGILPENCDLLVRSSAIPANHSACATARARGLPSVRRGELLAEVLRDRKLLAVCGSHGKTTTTAMLITVLREAGFPAGHVLGGFFAGEALAPAAVGANDWVVAEVDESDGTISCFSPEITLVVNLDWDHPDHYRQPEELEQAFSALADRTRGVVLVSVACARSRRLMPGALSFGAGGDFSASLAGVTGQQMRLQLGGRFSALTVSVRAQGDYNAANATAALAAAQLMGAALTPESLTAYPGVQRRQTVLHDDAILTVIEDYAHHPAEIRALLNGLRSQVGAGASLVVVFQPHRFSRTAQFRSEFAEAFALADRVHLLDVYSAGEAPVPGGTSVDLFAEFKKKSKAGTTDYHSGDAPALNQMLWRELRRGDLVVFVGAGDVGRKARVWLAAKPEGFMPPEIWNEFLAEFALGLGADAKLRREEPLGPRTTMRVGGAARLYAEPAGIADLQSLLRSATMRHVPVHFLGRGSNLIVPDEGVDGLVISLGHECWAKFELRDGGRVWVGAGLRLRNLCGLAAAAGFGGFEFLEGIPGNVGGALRMNAGAMGGWMFDVVEEVQIMTLDGDVKTLPKSALHIGYRNCAELRESISLGALLRPTAPVESTAVARQMDVYRRKRHESQPRESSAGCVFKNPPGDSAGRLIDHCGLKGQRVGGAEISSVHANFIINRGGATAADVLELVRRVRTKVREYSGITLEPEVLLFGKEWEDVL